MARLDEDVTVKRFQRKGSQGGCCRKMKNSPHRGGSRQSAPHHRGPGGRRDPATPTGCKMSMMMKRPPEGGLFIFICRWHLPPPFRFSFLCAWSRCTTCISDISFDKAPVMVGDQEGVAHRAVRHGRDAMIAESVRRRRVASDWGLVRSVRCRGWFVVGDKETRQRDLLEQGGTGMASSSPWDRCRPQRHLPSPDSSRAVG